MSNSTYSGSLSPTKRSQSPLLQEVRNHIRRLHMSIRTEEAYLKWLEEYLRFHRQKAGDWKHPTELGNEAINDFLTHLAVDRNVSASTQNQAFSAILFLYRKVLKVEISVDAERAKKPQRLPVVLSIEEVKRLLLAIPEGVLRVMAGLMYGSGLRLMEACRIRVKDIDFDRRQIMVRDGKGAKDRVVPLPQKLLPALKRQVEAVAKLHAEDLATGAGNVWLPYALAEKYPQAGKSLAWQYLFPAKSLSTEPRPREADERSRQASLPELRRHHIHESSVQKAVTTAVKRAGIQKKATCHSLRKVYSYYDISWRKGYLKGKRAWLLSSRGSWRPVLTVSISA